MSSARRPILILTMLLLAGARLMGATSPESRAFDAAANAFRGTFYDRAEAEFADFCQKFPQSPRLAEAILFQAEARLEQTNYAGAIELLSSRQSTAGTLADQYLFWLAEVCLRKGDYRTAADSFAKLVKEYPASSRRLEAAIREATARAKLAEWPRVVELLKETNGVFQTTARTNAGRELAMRGYLLLSQAQFAQRDYRGAEATLEPLGKLLPSPASSWERQYVLCRIELAEGRLEEALQNSTNLLALAKTTAERNLQAESIAFRGGILERLGRTDEAIAAYTNNLADGFPAEQQRQALLKITELSLTQNRIPEAAQMMERFLSQYPESALADLAWLTLGELRLRQHAGGPGTNLISNAVTNVSGATNSLQQALDAFEMLTKKFPQSPHFGKAQLGRGWCFWLTNQLPASQKAFQAAVERLPVSADQAIAYFKLGDAEFRQGDFKGAITNYNTIIEKFGSMPEVETNLFESALYQMMRAGLAAGELAPATNALGKILAWYPNGFHADRAVLLTGEAISREGNPELARRIFSEFLKTAPGARLAPEVELAIARTHEQENEWGKANQEYEKWLGRYPSHDARPRAEYARGNAAAQAGDKINALICFTNFVVQFRTNELAPLALWWVAGYYFGVGDSLGLQNAEVSYQLLYKNWPASELTYQAQMMAGRVALARQGWDSAEDYFRKLWNDTNCTNTELRLQALFALGDTLMSRDSTNKLAEYAKAISVFTTICESYPASHQAVRAWGEKADCLLQWASIRASMNRPAMHFRRCWNHHRLTPKPAALPRLAWGWSSKRWRNKRAARSK